MLHQVNEKRLINHCINFQLCNFDFGNICRRDLSGDYPCAGFCLHLPTVTNIPWETTCSLRCDTQSRQTLCPGDAAYFNSKRRLGRAPLKLGAFVTLCGLSWKVSKTFSRSADTVTSLPGPLSLRGRPAGRPARGH